MTIETNYTQVRENLASLFDRVVDDAEVVVVRRRGKGQSRSRDVAIIAADELESLLETAYLLRSPKNAERLLSALARAEAQTTPPSSIEDLRREVGLTNASLIANSATVLEDLQREVDSEKTSNLESVIQ